MSNIQQTTNSTRALGLVTTGQPCSDGAGVQLTRLIGNNELSMLDPFLMLDVFQSSKPQDYLAGFPSHPHRGFETVTYMLAGHMRHKDNAGNEGVISPYGVQWMTAGRGIVHSEMPEQESGLLKGFQLWVNLPKKHKMTDPHYQEFPADKVAVEKRADGGEIRVISGRTDNGTTGVVVNHYVKPTYMQVTLPENAHFSQSIAEEDNTFIYMISGSIQIGDENKTLVENQLGILINGSNVDLVANKASSFLLVSAKPLNEPVARGGPFVMNTRAEVMQAYSDLQNNLF
ncbi:MAG: pirin family protein [Colwellia sp.]|nr:pirin family protein [Colwellia sp.]MCW9081249.1 pirin family protein [Colwellia sp.]